MKQAKALDLPFVWVFCSLLVFGMGVMGCHKHDHSEHTQGEKARRHDKHEAHDKNTVTLHPKALNFSNLQLVRVQAKPARRPQVEAVGHIALAPSSISRVGSRVAGRIVRWYVALGQKVKRGQALVLLDSPEAGRARAVYLKNNALHTLAATEYKRTQRLKRIGLVSAKRLLASKTALQRAEISLRSAKAQLRILDIPTPKGSKLNNITGRFLLRAPVSGEITSLPSRRGAWVNPQTSILSIENRRKVWALLELYAADLPYVNVGSAVHLYGPGLHKHLEGKIQYLASRFERGAQTLEARVVLHNPRDQLRPGQFVSAQIETLQTKGRDTHNKRGSLRHNTAAPALFVSEEAIQRLGRRQVVFVVGQERGHYQVRTVVALESTSGMVRLLHGVKAGETLVGRGSFLLKSELMRDSLESEHGHAH